MILKETIKSGDNKRETYANSFYRVYADYFKGRIVTMTITPKNRNGYMPEIFFDNGIFGKEKIKFEIQTASYGTLSTKEIEKAIDGYRKAIETVHEMETIFCDD